jgi:hypothetical protein
MVEQQRRRYRHAGEQRQERHQETSLNPHCHALAIPPNARAVER